MALSILPLGCAAFSHLSSQCRIRASPEWRRRGHGQSPRPGYRQLLRVGLSGDGDTPPEGSAEERVWCGLCGDGGGWCTCGRCMGEGGLPTRPGLAGVKGKVGWAKCKTCFGQTVVPCLFCGMPDAAQWKLWVQQSRRRPKPSPEEIRTTKPHLNPEP